MSRTPTGEPKNAPSAPERLLLEGASASALGLAVGVSVGVGEGAGLSDGLGVGARTEYWAHRGWGWTTQIMCPPGAVSGLIVTSCLKFPEESASAPPREWSGESR